MYLSRLVIENFRCFGDGDARFELNLKNGFTALVGENDAGKTAIVDALRFAFGTTDQEWLRLEDSDFHKLEATSREIRISCEFRDLKVADRRAFVEYLTYGDSTNPEPYLCVTWTASASGFSTRGRPVRRVEVRSGKNGDGPIIASEPRQLLQATYLRPLRDANHSLTSGRGSRLSQVLQNTIQVRDGGVGFDATQKVDPQTLNVLGIGDLANALLENQSGIKETREQIDKHLRALCLHGGGLNSAIKVSASKDPEVRLRQLLERLDLNLSNMDEFGLGTGNLLFMACELLLLTQEHSGSKLLLIEEPEAHLHPQRQLQVMKTLQQQSDEQDIQILTTTHSPNLASAVALDNIVVIHNRRAFSMANGETGLDQSDYRFLSRFLDVTKANLFFARAVMIVEGDAENILIPTLAKLLERDFTERGVSIVNVGGVGLRRYARIFHRKTTEVLNIPVACVTDMDVMPNCAPFIIGKIRNGASWPEKKGRRWRAVKDYSVTELQENRAEKVAKASGQHVKTFVSDGWTLEYDLALGPKIEGIFTGGLAEDVFVSACLAENDERIHSGAKDRKKLEKAALRRFAEMRSHAIAQDGCDVAEVLATQVYERFARQRASKAVAAQYLSGRLLSRFEKGTLSPSSLRSRLPHYLLEAIEYVTGGKVSE